MSVVLVTGSSGLIGSEAIKYYAAKKYDVIGIDNNLRKTFFGGDACTNWNKLELIKTIKNYVHYDIDIRSNEDVESILKKYSKDISIIIHAAAQPSHDWAASNPFMDFTVNANGTLVMLENYRKYSPEAVFIFTSTNKVYGNTPNFLPLIEGKKRYEIDPAHKWSAGIDESMSIDQTLHSLFGASKVAADVLVQEYGKYFKLKTGVFRGGCLTGPAHSGTQLHGFLSYLMRCCTSGKDYTIFGYHGKQVRDNIHSHDLIHAFDEYSKNPNGGEVYNIGGGRFSNCSMLEAIEMCEEITKKKLNYQYDPTARSGDHMWWISGLDKFRGHYPGWQPKYDVRAILEEIYDVQKGYPR